MDQYEFFHAKIFTFVIEMALYMVSSYFELEKMTSLKDAYNSGPLGAVWSKKQLAVAVSLFVLGVLMFAVATVFAATDILVEQYDMVWWEVWQISGILAGLALPVVTISVFSILPSSRFQQFGAGIGVAVIIVSILIFYTIFPENWVRESTSHAFVVVGLYLFGSVLSIGFLFDAVTSFRQRNTPGGTVTLSFNDD